jgi:uncharacterized membrane protein SirB2
MSSPLAQLAHSISTSAVHHLAVNWLRNVPGLPPIVQTVHILSIGCIMGSIVIINLRVLGVAVPSQNVNEMLRRLMPWVWTSLVLLFFSGAMFVVATPARYFANPIFGIKFALLLPAVALAVVLQQLFKKNPASRASVKVIAAVSLLLWFGVAMAGRWIAYLDYLLPVE